MLGQIAASNFRGAFFLIRTQDGKIPTVGMQDGQEADASIKHKARQLVYVGLRRHVVVHAVHSFSPLTSTPNLDCHQL
jgi:hypothetical protein